MDKFHHKLKSNYTLKLLKKLYLLNSPKKNKVISRFYRGSILHMKLIFKKFIKKGLKFSELQVLPRNVPHDFEGIVPPHIASPKLVHFLPRATILLGPDTAS